MEVKVLNINEFRKQLGERMDAAFWRKEPTVIEHGARKEPRAALVPFDVGPEPLIIDNKGDIRSVVVSREWFEQAKALMAKKK